MCLIITKEGAKRKPLEITKLRAPKQKWVAGKTQNEIAEAQMDLDDENEDKDEEVENHM